MTYEELLPILDKNGFYSEELTKDDRCLFVFTKSAYCDDAIMLLAFNDYKPKLAEIQFYNKFYLTKAGIVSANTVTTDWADNDFYNEITSEKIDKKCQKIALRIKTLVERAKLDRIKNDF